MTIKALLSMKLDDKIGKSGVTVLSGPESKRKGDRDDPGEPAEEYLGGPE